jgi:hypothetical protein
MTGKIRDRGLVRSTMLVIPRFGQTKQRYNSYVTTALLVPHERNSLATRTLSMTPQSTPACDLSAHEDKRNTALLHIQYTSATITS